MASYKFNFLAAALVFIIFLTLVGGPQNRSRKPTSPRVIECLTKMQEYCEKAIPDIEWCAKKSLDYYPWKTILEHHECAKALIHHWDASKPIVRLMNGIVPDYMVRYHAKLLKSIGPGKLLPPGKYCLQRVGIHKNEEAKMQACLNNLEEFGDHPKGILKYAIHRTSLSNENYEPGNFAKEYLKHISKEAQIKVKMPNPIRYCKTSFNGQV